MRKQAGIERSREDYEQPMLLAVFRSASLNDALARFPARSTYRVLRPELNGYWQFFGRVEVPDGWFFHAPVPADATLGSVDALALIREAAGFACECEFEHVSLWNMRVAIADRYRAGRIFGFQCRSCARPSRMDWRRTAARSSWCDRTNTSPGFTTVRHSPHAMCSTVSPVASPRARSRAAATPHPGTR